MPNTNEVPNPVLVENLSDLADRYLKKTIALGDERRRAADLEQTIADTAAAVLEAKAILHALELSGVSSPYTLLLSAALLKAEQHLLKPTGLLDDAGEDLGVLKTRREEFPAIHGDDR